ncbi:hypothetical protein MBLNU230_g2602t1 [Neophaeotheca triangularis]
MLGVWRFSTSADGALAESKGTAIHALDYMPLRPPSSALLRFLSNGSLRSFCPSRCASNIRLRKEAFSTRSPIQQLAAAHGKGVDRKYFWANAQHKSQDGRRNGARKAVAVPTEDVPSFTSRAPHPRGHGRAIPEELPHRRRRRLKESESAANPAADVPLPPDASSTLSKAAEASPAKSMRRTISTYLALTKPRLAFLIVLTTTASYSTYPVPALLSTSATAAPSLSTLTLLFLTTGTFLTIASANTLNMLFEPAHDAKMSRTRNRPLVRNLISKRAAVLFAIATGALGTLELWYGVNPTTALLGASNIALYAFAYTALKRIHPVNTWVGAIVGAVPPLMGWVAAASQYSTTAPITTPGAAGVWEESKELLFTHQAIGGWLLAGLLFAWQFPHFFALSHAVRHEYASAGYKMLTSTNIPMAARVSLRYSLLMFPICFGLSYYGVTDPAFVATSSLINGWMVREAIRMWRHNGEKGSARALFWASVWQLPIVLVLAMVQKKGLADRAWRGIMGEPDDEDEWEDIE